MLRNRIKLYIISSSRFNLTLWIIAGSILIASILNYFQSYLWWNLLSTDLIIIGIIDSFLIALIIAPLAIKLVNRFIKAEEERNSQEALAKSEEKFRLITENIAEVVFLTDDQGKVDFISSSCVSIFGFTPDEMIGHVFTEFLIESERPKAMKEFLKVVQQRSGTKNLLLSMKRKTNSPFYGELNATIFEYNNSFHILGTIRDISEQKRIETALREHEYFLTKSQEVGGLGSYYMNINTGFWICSKKLNDVFGIDDSFTKNVEGWITLIHPDHVAEMTDHFMNHVVANRNRFDKEYKIIRHNDKEVRWVYGLGELEFDDQNNPIKMIGTIQDITERKEAEDNILKSENLLRTIIDNAPFGAHTYELNENGELIFSGFNKAANEILKFDHSQLLNKSIAEAFPPLAETEIPQAYKNVILSGDIFEMDQISYQDNDIAGAFVIHAVRIAPKRMTVFFRDITDQKKYETELIAAKEKAEEMNKIKSYFFANMSHELRTPFVGIQGLSEIIGELSADLEIKKLAEKIFESSKRFVETLNKILAVTKIEFNKLKPMISEFDLETLIVEVLDLFKSAADQSGLYLKKIISDNPIIIKSDQELIREIISNLISNGIKFTKEGGVEIRAAKKIIDNNEKFLIEVIDTGIGIPPSMQNLVWEEFRQASEGINRRFEGTGLGLTISKRYVQILGGTIELESEEGKGSKFIIKIPNCEKINTNKIIDEKSGPVINNKPASENGALKKNILYVEDDENSQEVVKHWLSKYYSVDIGWNADNAQAMVNKNSYDLILMDINLGYGVDGVTLTKMIRELPQYKNIPIVALTAYAADTEKEEFLSKGMSHYLSKPFTSKDLINLLSEIFKNN